MQHSGCRESEAAEPERDRGWYSFCVGARRHKTRDKALGSGKTLAKTCVDNSLQQSLHHFEIIIGNAVQGFDVELLLNMYDRTLLWE